MNRYRERIIRSWEDTFELQFLPPATPEELSHVESVLGFPLPAALRELYQEFNGVWIGYGTPEGTPSLVVDGAFDPWFVWPCSLMLLKRDALRKTWYSEIEGWLEEFSKCVMFDDSEGGASFHFMTDLGAWGVRPGFIGRWDHDGNPTELSESLEEYLSP